MQHLSEIESSKRDPRLSSIERIADAMELAVMLVPEHMAPDIRRYIASQGRVFTATQPTKETSHDNHLSIPALAGNPKLHGSPITSGMTKGGSGVTRG